MEKEPHLYESGKETNTLFDRAIKHIDRKYNVRFNEISLQYQIKLIEATKWSALNLNSLLIELEQAGIKMSMKKLEILFRSHLIERYNPIKGYFNRLAKWEGKDYISTLCSYVHTVDDELFRYHLEKWLTRTVLCALVEGRVNKQCLVLTSPKQNIGKTTFFRFLVPPDLKDFYVEDIGTDKDSLIKLSKNFIINMDELAIQGKSNINALKSFISKTHINERLPYGRRQERLERICSFVGSTNETDFLIDETGNVRWLVFEVESIDFAYSKEVDINKVWAQAYYNAFERKNYNPELTKSDVIENEKRNELFQYWTLEKELIAKYFEYGKDKGDFKTATDIIIDLRAMGVGMKLNSAKVGKALKSLKFPVARHMGPKRSHGYLAKQKFRIT